MACEQIFVDLTYCYFVNALSLYALSSNRALLLLIVLYGGNILMFVSMFFPLIQVEEARTKVSETSTRMYNSVLEAHEKSKDLDKTYKDLTKDVQGLNKEKESTDKQRSEAIQKRTQLELDDKDLREKMSVNIKAKVFF